MKRLLIGLVILGSMLFAGAVQMDFLMSGLMNNSGTPLAYGTVSFYVNNGGTTSKAIYASSTISTANLLPSSISLNASGVPTRVPFGSGVYRVVWKDRYGVTVKTMTDVQYGATPSANNGVIDVRASYGSNNQAIQDAITAAGAGSFTLYFSAGQYTISSSKVFPSNLQIEFAKGAYFTVTGTTVSINASILAPQNEWIFRDGGSGIVQISTANNPIILSAWKNTSGVVDIQSVLNTTTLNTTVLSTTMLNGVSAAIQSISVSGNFSVTGDIQIISTLDILFSGAISATDHLRITSNVSCDSFISAYAEGAGFADKALIQALDFTSGTIIAQAVMNWDNGVYANGITVPAPANRITVIRIDDIDGPSTAKIVRWKLGKY